MIGACWQDARDSDDVRNFLAAVRGEERDLSPISEAVNSMEVGEESVEKAGGD